MTETSANSLYEVHRGVIPKNSQVFKDMPQPLEQSTIKYFPVVILSDSEQDVDHFLSVIYTTREYSTSTSSFVDTAY